MSSRIALVQLLLLVLFAEPASAADAAYERVLIDRVQSAFAPSGPMVVEGIEVQRTCGSPLLLELQQRWPELSLAAQAQIAGLVAFDRPVLPEFYDTPDGQFRIHFARSGADSINMSFGVGAGNIPVYILNCAEILTHVAAKQVDTLGFRFPVSDAVPRPQEDPRFDVYFEALSSNFYGLTYPDTTINNGSGNAWWATSYMVLHSDYTKLTGYQNRPFDAMAVTVAHEFHHASQWSYDAFESEERVEGGSLRSFPWWLEASATAMEEIVYDHVNDYYGYLPFWFNNPNISLRAFSSSASADGLHPYASCIWPLYLAERFGPGILQEIWQECGEVDGFNTFAAFNTVLANRNTTFRQEWSEFLVWNYFTGPRAAAWNFPEAAQFPSFELPDTLRYSSFPVSDTSTQLNYPKSPDELAAAYMRFESLPSDTPTTFRIVFNAHAPTSFEEWTVVTAGISGLLKPTILTHNIFSTIEVSNWNSFDEILVIATPFKSNPVQTQFDRRLAFRFEVSDTLTPGGTKTAIQRIFSNPLVLTGASGAAFEVEVLRATAVPVSMRIFTIDGKEVRGGEKDNNATNQLYVQAGRSSPRMKWDGTTSGGETVATGVYLALVQIGDVTEVVKVAVKNQSR